MRWAEVGVVQAGTAESMAKKKGEVVKKTGA